MGYVENNLLKDETIIYKTKLHKIIFFWPGFVFISSIFNLSFITIDNIVKNYSTGEERMASTYVMIGIILFMDALIRYLTSEFAITNKRIIIKVGLIKRITLEMDREKIDESIVVNQGILGRIFNYGTIVISGTGSTKQIFKAIVNPIQFRKIAQEK